MKKLTAVLLAALMLFMLTGCGQRDAGTSLPGGKDPQNTQNPSAPGDQTPSTTGGLDGKTTLIMGTNAEFPPYEFHEGGEIKGIDAEIAGAIAQKLGLELKIEDMEFGAVIPSLQSGKIDVGLAGMTVTDERLLEVNFSTSYATGVQVIIVREDSDMQGPEDLPGKTIGVQLTTTGDLYMTWDFEDEGLATVDRYDKGADAVMALLGGKIDCVVIDNEPAKSFVKANEGLKILETEYTTEDYAIAIAKDNTELLTAVNQALKELTEDGTIQSIIDKYIPAD